MIKTVARGTTFNNLTATMSVTTMFSERQLLRWVLKLKSPSAHSFDVAWAEDMFGSSLPPGVDINDVYSPDDRYLVYIDGIVVAPVSLGTVIVYTKTEFPSVSIYWVDMFHSLPDILASVEIQWDAAYLPPELKPPADGAEGDEGEGDKSAAGKYLIPAAVGLGLAVAAIMISKD